jgi:hypothetical protein
LVAEVEARASAYRGSDNRILVHPVVVFMKLNLKQIPSLTTSLKEYVYSRQHASVLLGPSSGLASIMSRAEVVFTIIITYHLLLIHLCLVI